MSEKQILYLPLIDALPEKLGLPERYGHIALAPVIELHPPDDPEAA